MHRRARINWLLLLLSLYLLLIVAWILISHFSVIAAGQAAYEITLIVVGLLALVGVWWALFRMRAN